MKGSLQRIALALLEEHREKGELPTNGRFVFYELEQRGVVRKSRAERQVLARRLREQA